MASMKFGKGTELWQMFTDYWIMCQEVWVIEDSEDYWTQVVKETNAFTKKYNECRFAVRLASALIDELWAQEKEDKGI